ncbi:MAG TPA: sugar phosphate nucleotidyltransferase [Saprospiraceae bacterium]|nr:nucleotidyltransferase [Saprospiraceae bacterium]MCB9271375.1 nucleotidyltransferase [Lewinellaceae bacterium]HPG07264.1 sugar phosphate nucleotidyltransferase [Saprospiraceae bacterium]HPR00648.1 sugar phosphate nucleotidyltransferase [Saprospiraceae bacterium]HRV83802.1 sugar phosphate nucleotidyltransferase [Saprospiraceae bacterium]
MTKPTLLILAAGKGSRYGGLKQMDAFGPNGETIIDYSIYDAIEAGFGKIVFIVRESFVEEFKALFEPKVNNQVETVYVCQELDILPDGFEAPKDRTKPWGTAHAVWVAKEVIHEPFAVINADDYYGQEAFHTMAKFLTEDVTDHLYSYVAYSLVNTLSEHGTVNRGVCHVDQEGFLTSVEEIIKIRRQSDGIISFPDPAGGSDRLLTEDTLVSMNFWGFHPSYFDLSEVILKQFLSQHGEEEKSEFYIPTAIFTMMRTDGIKVQSLYSEATWFGVTYPEDKPMVQARLNELITSGAYPDQLWRDE